MNDDQDKKSIGLRLKQIRDYHNLSQPAFSKLLNVTKQTVLNYEKGYRAPDINYLIKLKETFKISLDWVIYGEGLMIKSQITIYDLYPNLSRDNTKRFLEMLDKIANDEIFYHNIMMAYLQLNLETKNINKMDRSINE